MFFSPLNAFSLPPLEEEQVRIVHSDKQSGNVYHFLENDVRLIFPHKKFACFIVTLNMFSLPDCFFENVYLLSCPHGCLLWLLPTHGVLRGCKDS